MNLKTYIRSIFLSVVMLLSAAGAWAQARSVTGIVYETDGKTPLVGAAVILKGTTTGVTTNVDGTYSIQVKSDSDILVFQSLGYDTQEIQVGPRTAINVTLKESSQKIEDVVVTALGITRSEKSVGYAITKVSNESLTQSISSNWINNMNGKVAGLSMSSAGTGPGGTVRVTLRGDSSLNYGSNEALFVVDGIPMLSGTVGSGSGANYANADSPVDFGNSVADINPDDIESVSVLKGPAAAALYGSLAQNGVVLITTKSGREKPGIGVTYSGTVTFEKAGFWPDFQKTYGPSANGDVLQTDSEFSAWGIPASAASDGIGVQRSMSRYTYGERFDASKKRYLYMSKNWETGEYTKLPWVYADDWYTGLFETGVTWTNTVTIDGSTGRGTSARFSFTDTRNDWIMPNTGFNQQNFALALQQKISKHIQFSGKVNYVRKDSENMPISGYSSSSPLYGLIWNYNTNPASTYADEYFNGRFTQANYDAAVAGDKAGRHDLQNSLICLDHPQKTALKDIYNPYRTLYEELNKLDRDRVFGNVNLNIEFMPQLTLNLRGGMDMNIEWRSQQKPMLGTGYPEGMYREKTIRQYEYSSDFLLKYNNSFWDRLGVTAAFGGSTLRNKYYSTTVEASKLLNEGPGMFSFANSAVALDTSPYRSNKAIRSLYGFINLSWDDTYFIDITARNDWSSTLHPSQWSYFYPSVSASVLLDKALKINSPNVNMLKLRASWANVGNDTSVFSLYPDYSTTAYPGGYVIPTTIPNPLIAPENSESWEVGLDTRFFQSRLNIDLAFYKTTTTDQIISASQSAEIGATAMKINAGRIENKGVEVSVRAVPVKTRNFTWEITANWSLNKNKLCALTPEWDPATPLQTSTSTTVGSRVYIKSYVGESMHHIYGKTFKKAPAGSFYVDEDGRQVDCSGMTILSTSTGRPSFTEPDQYIAQVNPDWKAGFGTTLRYKGLSMTATFTAQVGGNAYSVTNFALSYQGKLKNSLDNREDGFVLNGVNAVAQEDGSVVYTKNTTVVDNAIEYYRTNLWNRDNAESNTFSTDFLKLKELRLDYTLPKHLVAKTKFLQGVSIGFFATNVFCITDWPQYDPEAAGLVNGTNIYPGIETGTFPMTRTYGFNLKLQF